MKQLPIRKHGSDVLEEDALFRKVRNVSNGGAKVIRRGHGKRVEKYAALASFIRSNLSGVIFHWLNRGVIMIHDSLLGLSFCHDFYAWLVLNYEAA